ncbi:hypothetical protein D1007_21078 [Hordeum vulgare]|nr:hypothetical protein D1007_21078 [Hordeum vulgare]
MLITFQVLSKLFGSDSDILYVRYAKSYDSYLGWGRHGQHWCFGAITGDYCEVHKVMREDAGEMPLPNWKATTKSNQQHSSDLRISQQVIIFSAISFLFGLPVGLHISGSCTVY